ncbi:MAG: hypothetical protein HZB53_00215 [Chloroflexi bacterium]|nr:hypothetical protein [Chloroflexota bacterium]
MTTDADMLQHASENVREDKSLVSNLQAPEAAMLTDWGVAELSRDDGALDERINRVTAAMREINDLVGNKMTLVSDDIEERMAVLLVGDLDAGALVRLQIEREIAQVTAEKDHLDHMELLRQFTALTSQAWLSKAAHANRVRPLAPRAAATAQVKVHVDGVDDTVAPALAQNAAPAEKTQRLRPIPRPTPIPARKTGLLARLFGGR